MEANDLQFPVLRFLPTTLGFRLVAIYADHLLSGERSFYIPSVSEAMCQPEGESALAQQVRQLRRIPFAEVARVREKITSTSRSRGRSCFTVRADHGKGLRFALPVSQAETVRLALASKLDDRYWVRIPKRGSIGGGSLFLLAFLLTLPVLLTAIWNTKLAAGMALAALLLFSAACLYAHVRKGRWSLLRELSPEELDCLQTVRHTRRRKRRPTYSNALGWTLKLLGLAYWIAIASPLTEPLSEATANSGGGGGFLWTLLWAPAALLILAGYRLCQRRYDPRHSTDTRKPVLFLRPFEDDAATTLQPPGLLASLCGVRPDAPHFQLHLAPETGRVKLRTLALAANPVGLARMFLNHGVGSTEESLVRFFEDYGPVIAIGKPGETLATPGAARVYLEEGDWQREVLAELQRSQAVIMQPGASAGIHWELEQIREHVEPYRVLFCLVSFWKNPQDYERLSSELRRHLQVDLPRAVPYLGYPVFVYFDHGWKPQVQELSYRCPALWPLTADATDLRYSLQPFLEGMHGGERESPRQPRWLKGFGAFTARLAALILAFLVAMVPVLGIRLAAESIFSLPSSSLSLLSSPQQIPEHGSEAPTVTLQGRSVAYKLEVPATLEEQAPSEALVEHWRKTPDGRFALQVVASDHQEDLSALQKQRLAMNSGEGIAQSKLESVRTVQQAGADWTEVILLVQLGDGRSVREIVRATSGPSGTVLVIVHIVDPEEADSPYPRLADEIFHSFRFVG